MEDNDRYASSIEVKGIGEWYIFPHLAKWMKDAYDKHGDHDIKDFFEDIFILGLKAYEEQHEQWDREVKQEIEEMRQRDIERDNALHERFLKGEIQPEIVTTTDGREVTVYYDPDMR